MFKWTQTALLTGLLISSVGMAYEVEEGKITSPDEAIAALKAGNERFVTGNMINQDFARQIEQTSGGQHPYAAILSCLDSRIPTEIVFDQGIGDVFVGRVAGNVEDVNMVGSFEFAAALKGVKAIVVMGHTSCGAVDGACQGAKLGNLTQLLDEIQPAVELVKLQHPNENVCDAPLVNDISEANVVQTINDIRARSTVITTLENEGKVKLVGAMYDVSTGKVRFL
jgi:carbonic anhydrase